MPSLPPAEPLGTPPPLLGPAVRITSGPYNGLKGNLAKQCLPGGPDRSEVTNHQSPITNHQSPITGFASVVIEFEHAWFEIVTERRWLSGIPST